MKGSSWRFHRQPSWPPFKRSGGRCECTRLFTAHRAMPSARTMATAHFHHLSAQTIGGHDGLSNCQVLLYPVP